MLTIKPIKDYGRALADYLRQADYYSEGLQVDGVCFGQLCNKVGLKEGSCIADAHFASLATNRHAISGLQLTERMCTERRAGYDAVFSAPKSVSIQAFIGGDMRLIAAHEKAVVAALAELEKSACRQDGQGINKRHLITGKIAAAVFRHGESRALDPQLHSHAFIFNVTEDAAAGRLAAIETSEIFARTAYLTGVYRNVLAAEARKLGYCTEKAENGFELAGVSADLIRRFSKRSQERDEAVEAKERELGRSLTENEISNLVCLGRAKKLHHLSPDEVRNAQLQQVTEAELRALERLKTAQATIMKPTAVSDAVQRAQEHLFERRSVVAHHEILAALINECAGEYSLPELEAQIQHGRHDFLVVEGRVSTRATLVCERLLIDEINAGKNLHGSLGTTTRSAGLSENQRVAANIILGSRDHSVVLRGKAGAGKTHTLAAIIEGCDKETACFAPSTKAVAILHEDGKQQIACGSQKAGRSLTRATTTQRLLLDEKLQTSVRGKVLIIDEYGLLSSRDLLGLLKLSKRNDNRLLLVGDAAQHTSVEASAGARLIERESKVAIAELSEIRRQSSNSGYLAAAKALASGRLADGLRQLDSIGAVVEIREAGERTRCMVSDWFAAGGASRAKPDAAIMVAPTWVEIHELNREARAVLRREGYLKGEDYTASALWRRDMTRAQKKDVSSYAIGDIIVANRSTKFLPKDSAHAVVSKLGDRLVLRDGDGREVAVSPRQTGQTWHVCDSLSLPLADGDKIRLRAIGRIQTPHGDTRRVANGSTLTVTGVDGSGRPRLEDGSVLLSREFVHAYATTSHAAQGATVDSVFVANPISREGLYVGATRGRKAIKIYTPDRASLLDASRLRSEERETAIDLTRDAKEPVMPLSGLRKMIIEGVGRGRHLARACLAVFATSQSHASPIQERSTQSEHIVGAHIR